MTGGLRKLSLVRHSVPDMVQGIPASQWHLSAEGRRRCEALAEMLAPYEPAIVVTSQEPKAVETGQIVASILSLPWETVPGLHEHERSNAGFAGTHEQFVKQVSRLFKHPGELVFGSETADQAYERFAQAVTSNLERYASGNLAIVTHGTVMTLFIARANRFDPAPFWKSLGLPAFAVLSVPGFRLLQTVKQVLDAPIS
jgi:broad specificity phosphatase PhoE